MSSKGKVVLAVFGGVVAMLFTFGVIGAVANTSGKSTSSPTTSSTADVAPSDTQVPPVDPALRDLTCGEIGGVFVPHGTDGRGDCEPVDKRAHCHVSPGQQPDNYVANFVLSPPFPQGTVSRPEVERTLKGSSGIPGASNADCWRLPK